MSVTPRGIERWRHDRPIRSWEKLDRNLADLERKLSLLVSDFEALVIPGEAKYLHAELLADQTATLANGNHVEFNTPITDSGHVTVSTGIGQSSGIFTLPVGVWRLSCELDCSYGAANSFVVFAWGVVGGALIGTDAANEPLTRAVNTGGARHAEAIRVVTSGTEDVEVRMNSISNLTSINSNRSRAIITALA